MFFVGKMNQLIICFFLVLLLHCYGVWSGVCGFKTVPLNVKDCFGDWIRKFNKEDKKMILVGISALF